MQMDFKGQWAMLMSILADGAGAADMLCRILVAIDEDIVSLDIPRSPDGVKASMEFKVLHVNTSLPLPCPSYCRAGPVWHISACETVSPTVEHHAVELKNKVEAVQGSGTSDALCTL